eukprot:TRINITY_DN10703_c0_g1_i1.p1 TRINITY_DN10703_c0_g1~~TRINITY_DN10703_c0_g1_i1.p1  ORF type:complete len:399 (-),score=49.83 TRINITY_DN10703_c0_g1_i1:57-1253(-)
MQRTIQRYTIFYPTLPSSGSVPREKLRPFSQDVEGQQSADGAEAEKELDEIPHVSEIIELSEDIYALAYLLSRWASARTPRVASWEFNIKFWVTLVVTMSLQFGSIAAVAVFDPMKSDTSLLIDCASIHENRTNASSLIVECPNVEDMCRNMGRSMLRVDCALPYYETIFTHQEKGFKGVVLITWQILMCAALLRFIYQSEVLGVFSLFELHVWFKNIITAAESSGSEAEDKELLFEGNWPLIFPAIQYVCAICTAILSCCIIAGSCTAQAVVLNAMTFVFILDFDTFFNRYFLGRLRKERVKDPRAGDRNHERPLLINADVDDEPTSKRVEVGSSNKCILNRRRNDFKYLWNPRRDDESEADGESQDYRNLLRNGFALLYFLAPCLSVCLLRLQLSE